jgi:hypothetical protein
MTESHPFKPIRELTTLARGRAARAFPLETYQSYPIPVPGPKGLKVVFLFGPQHAVAGEGSHLAPPGVLMALNAASGDLEEMRKVTPQALGQPHAPTDTLGVDAMPPGMTADEFLAQRDRLQDAYDVLMPGFARGEKKPTPELKQAAERFKSAMPVVLEKVLMPYYASVGREFFPWLDAMSRG